MFLEEVSTYGLEVVAEQIARTSPGEVAEEESKSCAAVPPAKTTPLLAKSKLGVGGHQVAQKFTSTTLPRSSLRVQRLPDPRA